MHNSNPARRIIEKNIFVKFFIVRISGLCKDNGISNFGILFEYDRMTHARIVVTTSVAQSYCRYYFFEYTRKLHIITLK